MTETAVVVEAAPQQRPVSVTVQEVRALTPRMVRITVAGEGLEHFDHSGPDQLVRLFLPGEDGLVLPSTTEWWPEIQAMPAARRPTVRNYTVRYADRARRRIDIDFVLHGDSGPASAWAGRARPGDRIGVLSDGYRYRPEGADWQLLIGDETALPAIASIHEGLRTPALTFVEVGDARDELELAGEVTWLHRSGPRGARVLAALRALEFPEGVPYVWVAGESGLATSVRRHLVNERGIDKGRIYFCGYWRADA